MNKAITDGIVFMPEPFANGLQNWSSQNGRPGENTYDGASNASLVAADADFGVCLEMEKTQTEQKLRYTGETPIPQGTYLQVTVRIKCISGSLPAVEIAGWPGGSNNLEVAGLPNEAASVQLTSYGEVTELKAIIGPGLRTGVDMVWGEDPVFGHFGLNLTGPNGGIVRIDDIIIEDLTSVFYGKQLNLVDVKDFGAVGDGVTDDTDAFKAADDAANGRKVFVPAGTYYIGETVTMDNPVEFEGTLVMPESARLELKKGFDFNAYDAAFGDEVTAFKKAFQALMHSSDHDTLDLNGRIITIDEEIDMKDAAGGLTVSTGRRVIKNGMIDARSSSSWDDIVRTRTCSYDPNVDALILNSSLSISNLSVGALVEATSAGEGREIYVRSLNESSQEITMSKPLYTGVGTRNFRFTRFRYLLDFGGFTTIDRLIFEDVNFNCRSRCSGVLLPMGGNTITFRGCHFNRPKDRAITSAGTACQGLTLDHNQFISSEESEAVSSRTTIAVNLNQNDAKIRDNRASRFKHFLVSDGSNCIIKGNHIFQGDGDQTSNRTAGIVLTEAFCGNIISDNYIDNCYVEWTNEHDAFPANQDSSFTGLMINGNIFFASSVDPWYRFISVKPFGANQFLNGISITGNVFRASGANIDKAVGVDQSFAGLVKDSIREVSMFGNSFDGVLNQQANPIVVEISSTAANAIWSRNVQNALPFDAEARFVSSVAPNGDIERSNGANVYTLPAIDTEIGTGQTTVRLRWSEAVRGSVLCTISCDRLLAFS